jgi:glyoxylate reductase
MSQPTVFVTRKIAPSAAEKLAQYAQVETWEQDSPPPYEHLLEKAASVDGLFTLLTDRIDASCLRRQGRI